MKLLPIVLCSLALASCAEEPKPHPRLFTEVYLIDDHGRIPIRELEEDYPKLLCTLQALDGGYDHRVDTTSGKDPVVRISYTATKPRRLPEQANLVCPLGDSGKLMYPVRIVSPAYPL